MYYYADKNRFSFDNGNTNIVVMKSASGKPTAGKESIFKFHRINRKSHTSGQSEYVWELENLIGTRNAEKEKSDSLFYVKNRWHPETGELMIDPVGREQQESVGVVDEFDTDLKKIMDDLGIWEGNVTPVDEFAAEFGVIQKLIVSRSVNMDAESRFF